MAETWNDLWKITRFERQHKNILLLGSSMVMAYYILSTPITSTLLASAGQLGYFGALLIGVFYSYGATTPIAIATLFLMGQSLNPFLTAGVGALGAVFSDYLLYRFLRSSVVPEFITIEKKIEPELKILEHDLEKAFHIHPHVKRQISPKLQHYLAPLMAGLVLASPLPDELAMSLFGVIHYSTKKFLVLSYAIKFGGILIISLSATII